VIVIRNLDGQEIDADETAIVLVAGPRPRDVGSRTYVYGVTQAPLVTAERPDAFVARLGVTPPLAKLTRPDLTPVWVKAAAVTSVRRPIPDEQQGPGEVNSVLELGSHSQSLHEGVPAARGIINAHGGHV
jgi:hypothetical protein